VWTFSCPNIVYGDQALGYLTQMGGQKAFIISDKYSVKHGLVRRVTNQLDAAGIAWQLFDHLAGDPVWKTVEWAASAVGAYQPDWVIGLGDAGCLDAAKGVVSTLACGMTASNGAVVGDMRRGNGKSTRLLAIPVAGGDSNGAEAISAVFFNGAGLGRNPLHTGAVRQPDVAILDPDMVVGLPPQATADLGMDALCRAIEGYVSTWGSAITDGNGLVAAKQVFTFLPKAYTMCDCVDSHMELQYAAVMAGLCFGSTMAGLGYSLGHALATTCNIPVGRATGLMLPYTMAFLINGSLQTTAKYAEIARFCGVVARKDVDCAQELVRMVQTLAEQVEQPLCIRDLGIDSRAFDADLPRLVALVDHPTLADTVRRVPHRSELSAIFRYAYDGRPVDF